MKSIIITLLCLLTIGQISVAQKLFTERSTVQSLVKTSDFLDTAVAELKAEGLSVERNELTRTIFMSAGQCKGLARQASNAENITIDMLAKYQMYEDEYIDFLKEKNIGGGYYLFEPNDAVELTNYANTLYTLKAKMKANGYRYNLGTDNAEENLVLLQRFNKTYGKFAKLMESRFVEL